MTWQPSTASISMSSRRWGTPLGAGGGGGMAMGDAGVRIDTDRMGEITARLADRVEELEARAHQLAGEPFLLGSTQQVARILFEKLGLEPGRKGETGHSADTRGRPGPPAGRPP